MPAINWDSFKTTSISWFGHPNGIPSWLLTSPTNVWNALIDAIKQAILTLNNVAPAGVTASITVGASPFTYTAGGNVESVYVNGGTVTNVTRHGTTVAVASPCQVVLPPGQSVTVTYSAAPTMVRDY